MSRNTARRLEQGGVRAEHFLEDLKKLNKAAMIEIGARPGGSTPASQSSAWVTYAHPHPITSISESAQQMEVSAGPGTVCIILIQPHE